MRFVSGGDLPEIVAILIFALYASMLPEAHRNLFLLVGAALLAAFLTWRSNEKTKRKNAEAWEKLKAEIERLDVDEKVKGELLKTIDDLYSEARRNGFAVKVVKLGDSGSSEERRP